MDKLCCQMLKSLHEPKLAIKLPKANENGTCTICSFCFENELRRLPCGHVFHYECISNYLTCCPKCKQKVVFNEEENLMYL